MTALGKACKNLGGTGGVGRTVENLRLEPMRLRALTLEMEIGHARHDSTFTESKLACSLCFSTALGTHGNDPLYLASRPPPPCADDRRIRCDGGRSAYDRAGG